MSNKELWNKRLPEHPWGDRASLTASILLGQLKPNSLVGDIGSGYGRDILAMLDAGHRVIGIEEALSGLNETIKQIKTLNLGLSPLLLSTEALAKLRGSTSELKEKINSSNNPLLLEADFTQALLPANIFDGLYSHRMLHLLTQDQEVESFSEQAARTLKKEGLFCVGARDTRDFNPAQMRMIDQTTAEYTLPDRKGHLVRFWYEARYRGVFEQSFEMVDFIEGQEPESRNNPGVTSHFTIMLAKKPAAIIG